MDTFLAHSESDYAPAQTYADHIENVASRSLDNLDSILKYYRGPIPKAMLRFIVQQAAEWHDIGKLHDQCQSILRGERRFGKMLNHVDAGCALAIQLRRECLKYGDRNIADAFLCVAILIHGHHIGLMAEPKDGTQPIINPKESTIKAQETYFRDGKAPDGYLTEQEIASIANDLEKRAKDVRVRDLTDKDLNTIISRHEMSVDIKKVNPAGKRFRFKQITPLMLRLLGSCMFEADHSDTARAMGFDIPPAHEPTRNLDPDKRLDRLTAHVASLHDGSRKQTQRARDKLFDLCGSITVSDNSLFMIDSAVGTGKTTSATRLALRIAQEKSRRRIFHVAPFINIVSQTASKMRDSIGLPGDQSLGVAEHHHASNYGDDKIIMSKAMFNLAKASTVNWAHPVVCVTMVQFYESLMNNRPMRIKKLMKLPGSVIILDEFDNSVPVCLWESLSNLIKELSEQWECDFVFSSGTPVQYWRFPELQCAQIECRNVNDDEHAFLQSNLEGRRTIIDRRFIGSLISGDELLETVARHSGPRIVLCDTVINACSLAHQCIRKDFARQEDVYCLHTSLTVSDRQRILDEVKERTKDRHNIILFSTSIIETGVDISFRHGFTEIRTPQSLQQIRGRVNRSSDYERARKRNGEWASGCRIIPFQLIDTEADYPVTKNPQIDAMRGLLRDELTRDEQYFTNDLLNRIIERYMGRLLRGQGELEKSPVIASSERVMNLEAASKLAKVIDSWQAPLFCNIDPNNGLDIVSRILSDNIQAMNLGDVYSALNKGSASIMGANLDVRYFADCLFDFIDPEELETDAVLSRVEGNSLLILDGNYDSQMFGLEIDRMASKGLADLPMSRCINPARSIDPELLESIRHRRRVSFLQGQVEQVGFD